MSPVPTSVFESLVDMIISVHRVVLIYICRLSQVMLLTDVV